MDETATLKNGIVFHNKSTLPDGTIEITDTLPKQDYYKSLRRSSPSSPGSQFTINNSINVYDATSGQKKSKPIDYKPSGKQVQCSVLMLEGVEQIFTIDKNSYGFHLLKAICEKVELTETEYFGLTYRGNQHVDV
uniref:FERM domain-containing protein n=1 Tax=Mesocestoides corti TaxID=53468 RepID=A0A5K3FUG0_MESCO